MTAKQKFSAAKKCAVALLALALAGCGSQRLPAPVEDVAEPVAPRKAVEEKPEPVVARPDYHRVSKGETLIAIALNYGLDRDDLALWNNLSNPDLIQINQILRLKPPRNSPIASPVESVRSSGLVQVQQNTTPTIQPVTPAGSVGGTANTATGTANTATAAGTSAAGSNQAVTDAATNAATKAATAAATSAATGGGSQAIGQAATAAAVGSAAAAVASTIANVVVRSTVVNAPDAAPAASDVPETAQLKTTPLAAKYIYSPQLLKKLRQQWEQRPTAVATIPKPGAPSGKPLSTPETTAGTRAAATAAGAPTKSRQRFEVTWSWPTAGQVQTRFSEPGKGMDFAGSRGAPIFASADGEVIYVGTGVKSYGRMIIIKHPNDYLTAYAHVDEVFVKEGERVARGGKIAGFGDSGAEQVKLHFEVRKVGKPIDPLQVLPETPN